MRASSAVSPDPYDGWEYEDLNPWLWDMDSGYDLMASRMWDEDMMWQEWRGEFDDEVA